MASKKISIGSFDKVVQSQRENDKSIDWHGIEVNVKHTIGLTDMMEFVNDAVESCFSEAGSFVPEVMDFAIKSNILSRYANFTLPDNLEHRYQLIYGSDAVEAVCENINAEQLKEIISAIKCKVNYACDAKTSLIQQKASEMLNAFDDLSKQMTSMFSNISQDDIQKILGAISDGGINEEALVKAYLNQAKGTRTKKASK